MLVGAIYLYIAAMFIGDELQSAMSHQHFGKRVSLGAQVAAFSYLSLATLKHTYDYYSYRTQLSSAQRQPPNQQQQEG